MSKIKYNELAKDLLLGDNPLRCESCKHLKTTQYKLRHKIRRKRLLKNKWVCNKRGYEMDVDLDQWCDRHEVKL